MEEKKYPPIEDEYIKMDMTENGYRFTVTEESVWKMVSGNCSITSDAVYEMLRGKCEEKISELGENPMRFYMNAFYMNAFYVQCEAHYILIFEPPTSDEHGCFRHPFSTQKWG